MSASCQQRTLGSSALKLNQLASIALEVVVAERAAEVCESAFAPVIKQTAWSKKFMSGALLSTQEYLRENLEVAYSIKSAEQQP